MPKGVYIRGPRAPRPPQPGRTTEQINASLRRRLLAMSEAVTESGCLIFTGCLSRYGYGLINRDKAQLISAHRAAYTVFKGDIPPDLDVIHSCDVRCCINPDHLRVGTHKENMEDMVKRGRHNNKRLSSRDPWRMSQGKAATGPIG